MEKKTILIAFMVIGLMITNILAITRVLASNPPQNSTEATREICYQAIGRCHGIITRICTFEETHQRCIRYDPECPCIEEIGPVID